MDKVKEALSELGDVESMWDNAKKGKYQIIKRPFLTNLPLQYRE